MRFIVLPAVFAGLCLHCSVNDAANVTPPANGTPDPGKPAANTPVGETPANSTGGARLKARYLKTTDGAEFAQGIYDSKLDTTCTVANAADGKARCLPAERYLMDDPELHFADPSCLTSPLGGNSPFATSRFGYTRDAKNNGVHIYKATSGTTMTVPKSYRLDDKGACVAGDPNQEWYALTELPAADFVDGSVTKGPDKGGVSAKTFVGSDGSRIFLHYAATATDTECVVDLDSKGTLRCLPLKDATQESTDLFASSSCKGTSAAVVNSRLDAPPKYTYRTDPGKCSTRQWTFHAAAPSGKAFQLDGNNVCTETSFKAVSVGAEVPGTTFPEVQESAPWGQGRVKGLYYAVGTEPVTLRAQFDTIRNEGCQFVTDGKGEATCLPFALRINSGYFSDAACSTEAVPDYSSQSGNTCGTAPDPKYYLAPVDRAQNKKDHVYEITKLGQVSSLYMLNGNGVCTKTSAFPAGTYYQVGKEVPLGSFEKAQVVDR